MKFDRVNLFALVTAFAVVLSGYTAITTFMNNKRLDEERKEREERRAAWQAKISAPASDWYVIRGISVRDFVEGENTPVSFDREVRKPFTWDWDLTAWSTSAQPGDSPSCSIGDHRYQSPTKENMVVIVHWEKLWDRRPCHLGPGEYVIKVHGIVKATGYPDKEVERASNIFKVFPKGYQQGLSPEQVEKVEKLPLIEGN